MIDFDRVFRFLPSTSAGHVERDPPWAPPRNDTVAQAVPLLTDVVPEAVVPLASRPQQSGPRPEPVAPVINWAPVSPAQSRWSMAALDRRRLALTLLRTTTAGVILFALHMVSAGSAGKFLLQGLGLEEPADNGDPSRQLPVTGGAHSYQFGRELLSPLTSTPVHALEQASPPAGSEQLAQLVSAATELPNGTTEMTVARYNGHLREDSGNDPALPANEAGPRTPLPQLSVQPAPLVQPAQAPEAARPILKSDPVKRDHAPSHRMESRSPHSPDGGAGPKVPVVEAGEPKSTMMAPQIVSRPREVLKSSMNVRVRSGATEPLADTRRVPAMEKINLRKHGERTDENHPPLPLKHDTLLPGEGKGALPDAAAAAAVESSVRSIETPTGERTIGKRVRVTQARQDAQLLPGKKRSKATASRRLANVDLRARRSSLGAGARAQSHDRADHPTHINVFGVRIPTLKPEWADDVFRSKH